MCGDEAGLEVKRAEARGGSIGGLGDVGGDSCGDKGEDERSGAPGGVLGVISLDLDESMLSRFEMITMMRPK
jgi:hypothetical protein